MTDVIDQLRQLGEAAELHVEPVKPQDILVAPTGRGRWRQRRPMLSLGAAAAAVVGLICLGAGVAIFDDTPSEVVTSPFAAQADSALPTDPTEAKTDGVASTIPRENRPADHAGWQELRECESRSDYTANSGGFSGAYQFESATWAMMAKLLGVDQYRSAHQAPPAVQDAAASELYLEQGARVWPMCGQYVDGPMTSPVVHGWVDSTPTSLQLVDSQRDDDLIIFLEPDITEAEQLEIEAEITRWGNPALGEVSVSFVDKAAAFQEFGELFIDSPELIDSVDQSMLPSSIRVNFAALDPNAWSQNLDLGVLPDLSVVRELDGVLRVVLANGQGQSWSLDFGDTRVAVDWLSPLSAESLLSGPVAYSLGTQSVSIGRPAMVVAGHGEAPDDPFEGLADLEVGDAILLVSGSRATGGETHTFVVEKVGEVAADDPNRPTDPGLLTLTTQGSDPSVRLVVTAWHQSVEGPAR